MLEGVPYIFPPSGSRPTMRSGLGAVLGAPLGYNRLWLTLLLHAFSLPIASLYDVGLPTAWREACTRARLRLESFRTQKEARDGATRQGFAPLQDLEA